MKGVPRNLLWVDVMPPAGDFVYPLIYAIARASEIRFAELVLLRPADGLETQTLQNHRVQPRQQNIQPAALHRSFIHPRSCNSVVSSCQRSLHTERWFVNKDI